MPEDSSEQIQRDRPPLTPGRQALIVGCVGLQVSLLTGALAFPEHRETLLALFGFFGLMMFPIWVRLGELYEDHVA